MKTNNYFNINRFLQLIYRYLSLNYISKLTATGAACGILIFISLMTMMHSTVLNPETFLNLGLVLMILLGYLFTSSSLNEINSPSKASYFLTIPASTLEKLLASWFITSILYTVFAFAVLYFIEIAIMGIAGLLLGAKFTLINLFTESTFKVFGIYLVTQSVFLFGATYFRGNTFIKIIFSVFLIGLFLSIYTNILSYFILGMHHGSWSFSITSSDIQEINMTNGHLVQSISTAARIFFRYLMIPFFLFLSYLSLKEREG